MSTQAFTAIAASDKETLIQLLNQGVDVNTKDAEGYSLLHYALIKNQDQFVEFLLQKGADANIIDKVGQTPLHYCSLMNKKDIAKILIDHGASVLLSDMYGNQPLWTAVFNVKGKSERIELVRFLLENKGDANHKNKAGRSPLDFAKQVGNIELISILKT